MIEPIALLMKKDRASQVEKLKIDLENDAGKINRLNKHVDALSDSVKRYFFGAEGRRIASKICEMREPDQNCDSIVLGAKHYVSNEVRRLRKEIDEQSNGCGCSY